MGNGSAVKAAARSIHPQIFTAGARPAETLDEEDEEDGLYAKVAAEAAAKRAAKRQKYTAPALPPPLEDAKIEGPRRVSAAVEKNRGLTPHRRRDIKNPRVKVCPSILSFVGHLVCPLNCGCMIPQHGRPFCTRCTASNWGFV